MPSNVSEFTHVQNTWKVYPRVYRFQYWFNDLHSRFKRLTTGKPKSTVFKSSHLTKKLETLSSQLGNGLQVKVFGKRDIDPQKFVIASEELSKTNAQSKSLFSRKGSLKAKATDPGIKGITFVICYARVKDFNSEGLQKVLDTLKYFKSTEEQVQPDDGGPTFILCETSSSKKVDESKCAKFCSDIITALKSFELNLKAENVIVNPVGNILGGKISDVLEKRIFQGFVDIGTQLEEYIGDRHFDKNLMDIVETDQFLSPIQGFLRNGLGFVDILESKNDEPFLETVLTNLARVIRCAVVPPMSRKYSMSQDLCNRLAIESNFENEMIESICKNTRYHLSKLERPCQDMLQATKAGNKFHQFPGQSFVFIAYPLRDDIKKAFEKFEETLNSIRKASHTMRKMLFEVKGYLPHFNLNPNKPTQAKIPDKLREEIMAIDGVYGMGTIYGSVEIHLKDNIMETDVEQDVRNKIESSKFLEPVRFVKVLQMPKVFSFDTGSHIESQCTVAKCDGTLGGFARCDGDAALYGLTSAHAVHGVHSVDHDVFITNVNDGRRLFARSRPEMTVYPHEDRKSVIDIAAVKVINDEDIKLCTTKLKNEDGTNTATELYTGNVDDLVGSLVYKYGAGSELTKGLVCSMDYNIKDADVKDHLVLIESLPAHEQPHYATNGDSGSINCLPYLNGHEEMIKAVSMLCKGEYKVGESEYCITFLLRKGIEKLIESSLVRLNFCSSQN